jgi:thiamine-monophosphate kinase
MDLSDGLSSDLSRLCAASGVGACLETGRIPCLEHPDMARKHGLDPLTLALHGGDDYELLFTVPVGKAKLLPRAFQGISLTPIGKVTKESKLVLRDENGPEQLLPARGWDPFRKSGA